ncbi:ATP-binding protein [[Mycoplasma] testudinis]|uniref:ATP-binding protein n=1 Tax=[Mycoplasma] testudinis TaxID=33924 RepID=UPI0004891F34|nr:ATP-binding protein [[Mycoplasma] testudinis]
MYKRTISKRITECTKTFPVVLVTGPRQVGKSSLCLELNKSLKWKYVSLEIRSNYELATKDPELFLKINSFPLIIDEIQKAPILFEYIAPLVNENRYKNQNANGMFILTGSHQFSLMKGVSESLAGRIAIIKMSGLSFSEINEREEIPFEINPIVNTKRILPLSQDSLAKLIYKGSYPELHKNALLNTKEFYTSYVETFISKDLHEITKVKNENLFYKFIEILAAQTGNELVYANIASKIGVDLKTISSWVQILEASGLIMLLSPWIDSSAIKRLTKRQKIYFTDTGLACFLNKFDNHKTLLKSNQFGSLIETFAVNEIIKTHTNAYGVSANFYYYRDHNFNEIDLIILKDAKLHFIEVKAGIKYDLKDVKAFNVLQSKQYQIGNCGLVCITDSIYPIDKNIYAIPLSSL